MGIAIGGIGVGVGGELKGLLVDRAFPALAYFKVLEGGTRASKVDPARVIEY